MICFICNIIKLANINSKYRPLIEKSLKVIRRVADLNNQKVKLYFSENKRKRTSCIFCTKKSFESTRKNMPSYYKYDRSCRCWRNPEGLQINITK